MKKLIMLIVFILISQYAQASGSEANVGDFGTNQQAETITTTTETTVNQEGMPVTTAVGNGSPIYNQDACVISSGRGLQSLQLGISFNTLKVDKNCELLKLSRQLSSLGLKVAATSVLCQDPRVWWAMRNAATPCPIKGLIGEDAIDYYVKNPKYVPKPLVVDNSVTIQSTDECRGKRLRYDFTKRSFIRNEECSTE